jgi:hypothetical protein
MVKAMPSENAKLDLDAIKQALTKLESPKDRKARERAAVFAQLYEPIRDKLDGGVSKRHILDLLANYGLVLTYDQFAELLEAEAKRRGELELGKDPEAGDDEPTDAPLAGAKDTVTA